jgi:hypothetical protein
MKTSREVEWQGAKKSLRVRLFKGVEAAFSDEAGLRTERLLYGGLPAWVVGLGAGFLFAAFGVYLVSHAQLDRTTYMLFLAALAAGLGLSFSADRADRARDRLNDRAYQLSKSALDQVRA